MTTAPHSLAVDPLVEALRHSTATALAVVVEDEESGVVVDLNGDAVFESNSVQKLFTAGAALIELGPAYRYRTRLVASGDDIVLVAAGDLTLGSDDVVRLCHEAAAAGVRRVRSVVIDDSRYDRLPSVPAWKHYYVPGFTGPLSAFVLDRNRYRRDEAYVDDPVPANAARVVDAMRTAGIVVEVGWRRGRAGADASVVAEHSSPPLADILRDMGRASDSFSAELVAKELGAMHGTGTTAAGVAAIDAVASRLGLPSDASACAADASGLAAATTDTARRQVAWLRAMDATAVGAHFRRCLPVAGQSGTLAGRCGGTAAAGAVRAKTGTRRLHGTVNLAGYATTADGRRLRFAMTLTGAHSHADAVAAVDAAVVAMVGR